MKVLRVLVLDFDGVILESNDLKTAVFDEVFAQYPEHHAAMMAFHREHQSSSRYVKFAHLVEARLRRPGDTNLINGLAEEFSRRLADRMTACAPVPGALELLERFSGIVPTYLASVTPQAELESVLGRRALSRHFQAVYGCPPWEKARAVADIVQRHGGVTAGVLLVGDSAGDQRAALTAGVDFVARDSGLPFDTCPDVMCHDMFEVAEVLRARMDRTSDA
ncbi:MAG: hypothetical protein AMXMBFR57_16640 [Acidimicrobiia bacterium]